MKKQVVFVLILTIILTVFLSLIPLFTAQSNHVNMLFTHSHTKAFCNENNLCQDYEIVCNNKQVVSISPITGAFVQFSDTWKDARDEEMKNKIC